MKTVYVVGRDINVEEMFTSHKWVVVDRLEDADLVQFCGQTSVNPVLYGDKKMEDTVIDNNLDVYEKQFFDYCINNKIPMAGVGRGAQLLHVLSGGKLYQRVNKHQCRYGHATTIEETNNIKFKPLIEELQKQFPIKHIRGPWVPSCHNQMMKRNSGLTVLTAQEATLKETSEEKHGVSRILKTNNLIKDPEMIFHEVSRCLCYQPHPEWERREHVAVKFYFKCIRMFFGIKSKD